MRDRRAASMRRPRKRERGNSLVLALIVLTALGTLSMLTVFSVRGGIQTTANDRFHSIAMYAAESGGAAGMSWLRGQHSVGEPNWGALVEPSNISPQTPLGIVGNTIASGAVGNPLSVELRASYEVEIFNNRGDTGFLAGNDDDERVIVRSTGYGPNGAMAIIEWEISASSTSTGRPCTGYAQQGQSEDNSGRNDCLGAIDTGQTATFTP